MKVPGDESSCYRDYNNLLRTVPSASAPQISAAIKTLIRMVQVAVKTFWHCQTYWLLENARHLHE